MRGAEDAQGATAKKNQQAAQEMSNEPFVWFSDSDTSIVGDSICSKCRKDVPEDDVPLLLFRGEGDAMEIARFHWDCANELFKTGVLKLTTS